MVNTMNTDTGRTDNCPNATPSVESDRPDYVTKTIDEVLKVESFDRSTSERVADGIALFTGSIFFVGLHIIWFGLWLFFNTPGPALSPSILFSLIGEH